MRWLKLLRTSGLESYLFQAPVCQGPQVRQHRRASETDVVKLSFAHLRHQRAQGQQLIGPQLPHWAEGLEQAQKQNHILAADFVIREIFLHQSMTKQDEMPRGSS